MTEDAGILEAGAFETVDYDLRHWIPVPDRYVEAVAEAHGARALAVAVVRLLLLVIALAAEKRRRRKSVRELAAHLPTASRNRAWQAQRDAQAFWAAWELRGRERRTNTGQPPAQGEDRQRQADPPDPADTAAGRNRDTIRDTGMEDCGWLSGSSGTTSGRSRKRACTGTSQTDLTITPPLPHQQEDPIQRAPARHPVEGALPGYLARPLKQAGLHCLTEVAQFSRDGITGLVPKLARFASLEAIEGALRRNDLTWAGAGWTPPGRSTPMAAVALPEPEPVKKPPEPEPEPAPFQISPELVAMLNAQHARPLPRGR